ncbi:MAG: GtrA family protein [Terriglobales bacterium]|jgi:putative flippase GtrA
MASASNMEAESPSIPPVRSLRSRFAELTRHIPPGQLGRYLLVGVWNTAAGYGIYAGLVALLGNRIPYSYLAASLLGNIFGITLSFLGYKWFVFKTKGNYLREWARCVLVYSGAMVVGLILLPPMVFVVSHVTAKPKAAPYIAGALVMGVNVLISFFGHKKISFRQP